MQARPKLITPDYLVYEIRESKDLPLNIDEDFGDGTGLLIAAKNGWLDIVKLFIKGNATLDKRGYLGSTALMAAACNQHTDVVKELIAAGAQIELTSLPGMDALGWSLSNNNRSFATARALLEAGAHINSTALLLERLNLDVPQETMEDQYTCLSILCEQEEKLEKNISDDESWFEDHLDSKDEWIVHSGLNEMGLKQAEDLLHKLPQPSGKTYQTRAEAVIKEVDEATFKTLPKELVKMIVEYDNPFRHKPFRNNQNNKGVKIKESLIEAAKNGHTESVRAILEDKTINVNIEGETNYINLVDEYGMTPLMWAARNGHIETINVLLENKIIDINLRIYGEGSGGSTALIEATREGQTEIVKLLIANKADVNRQDRSKDTALILAAGYGYTEVVRVLLENKMINPDFQNWEGKTALIKAIRCGYIDIVRELVEHKADIDFLKDWAGHTALGAAKFYDKTDILDFLTNSKAHCEQSVKRMKLS